MNETALTQPRRILPRWRLFTTTSRMGELDPGIQANFTAPLLEDRPAILERWKETKNLSLAGEILNLGVVRRDPQLAMEAANFIERNRSKGKPRSALENLSLATFRMDGHPHRDEWLTESLRPTDRTIPFLRRLLKVNPRNAVAWAELALLHAVNGNKEHARKAMLVAVDLAPDDRFVMRSAVRCFAHLRKHDIGLKLISRCNRTRQDPWLLAAQIAMSQAAEKPQRFMKIAKSMLAGGDFGSWNLSELNAAVGSVLEQDGNHKNANKHFRLALTEPTENALCQIIVDRNTADWRKIVETIHPQKNFETEARNSYVELELQKAFESANRWLEDEPFSARPAMFGSFVAGVGLENYDDAIKMVDRGLQPNPQSSHLLNNKALFLARKGEVDKAQECLNLALAFHDGGSEVGVILKATQGLIHFRKGNIAEGRKLYQEAIDTAERAKRQAQATTARVFLAREELDAMTDQISETIQKARDEVKKLPTRALDTRIALALVISKAKKFEAIKAELENDRLTEP